MEMIGWGAGLVDGDRRHLAIFISGFLMPHTKAFHFLPFAERLTATKLFLRDDSPHQFREGIRGVTENEEENVEFLRYMIDKIGPERVTILAGSVGTHPAILWGHWLGVDDIHIIGPVTDFTTCLHTKRAHHPSFSAVAHEALNALNRGYPYANLRPFMAEHAEAVQAVDLYYGMSDPADVQQADVISDLPQVRSTVYYQGDHFRVPALVLRRDVDLIERICAPVIERPIDLRRQGPVPDVDLGYAVRRMP